MRRIAFVAAVTSALVLSSCGGGGGGHSRMFSPEDAGRDPVASHLAFPLQSGSVNVLGIDQSHVPLSRLPSVGERDGTRVLYGSLDDGAGSDTVAAYLSEAALFGDAVSRFTASPTVRVVATATEREREIVEWAVEAINHSLPSNLRMQIGPDLAASGAHADHVIEVEFLSCADYGRCGQAAASTAVNVSRDAQGKQTARRTQMSFARGTNAHGDDRLASILMAHELLHALGIDNHVGTQFASIMQEDNHYSFASVSLLAPLDREAINALYRRLDPGDDPTAFGPWSSSSVHIAGNGSQANFGVALRNGYAEPWAHGPAPRTTLSNNGALSGSATWTGTVLGLTPAAAAVAGDAEIGVDLSTLSGTADFTSLETWAANAAPGEAGTGTTWLDGDLGYTIAVTGNTFRETGGDAGRLTGIFTGRNHEGAAGTLDRPDLTAAFGADR